MVDSEQTEAAPIKKRHPRKHRAGAGLIATLVLATCVLIFSALVLSGRSVPLPKSVRDNVVETLNTRLTGSQISVDGLAVAIADGRVPRLTLSGVDVLGAGGERLATLNEVEAVLSAGALLQGRVSAEQVTLKGAQITIRRRTDGSFSIQNPTPAGGGAPLSLGDALGALDAAFEQGPLAALEEVEALDVVIALEDARSGRVWQATNARMVLKERAEGITVSVASDVFNGTDALAEVQVSFAFDGESRDTELGFRIIDMPSEDIALQSPALAWLSVLRAPISGAVRASLTGDGELRALDGTLDLANGVLQPDAIVEPVAFDAARAYFSYDPERARLDFDEVGVQSEDLRVTASGFSYVGGEPGEWAETYVGQFNLSEAVVLTDALFGAPASIDRARADIRLHLSPFRVEVADLFVEKGEVQASATGAVTISDGLWQVDADAKSEEIGKSEVLGFWPSRVAPKTRRWLTENVLAGRLSDVSFGVRFIQGTKPDIALSFDYDDAVVRYLKDMPVVQDGRGRATIHNREFVIEIDEGWVEAEDGSQVAGAGSVFRVPDIRQKPPNGQLSLVAEGALPTVLRVLDHPPLRVMERAGRSVDLASGDADVRAEVFLPLKKGIEYEDVIFDVSASARSMSSREIVPGRRVEADQIWLNATPEGLSIEGDGSIDGVPFNTRWQAALGDRAGEPTSAQGGVTLSAETLAAFGVTLPDQTVRGRGRADYEVVVGPGNGAIFKMQSDLRGIGMSIPPLGWNKSPSSQGALDFGMLLGETPDVLTLDFSAPGLAFSGDVDFKSDNTVRQLRLNRLRVGQWLDATARLVPAPGGAPPSVALDGGQLDLRSLPDFSAQNGDRTSSGSPISLRLDTVIVSDGIVMRPFRGQVTPSFGGLDGDFEARLAGQTLVRGSLVPAFGRTALRIEADDAGGVLRDVGMTESGRGGSLYLVMTPVNGAPAGTYDGEFRIDGMRLQDAPVLAGLLNAISVVGLIDQLASGGLGFDTIDGTFRVTPERVILRRLAAVGPSLGISAEGVYDPAAKELDMQGVVSPIYFVNGIGSLLTRRGEGLFGFNYRLTGPTQSPTVSVNPLSILTPGMFREIFRQPVPTQ